MEPALTAALLWLVFGATHVGLATRRVRAALVARPGEHGCPALLTIVGPRRQDAKVLARAGKPYADYLAATSAVPFAALLAGRQRWVWSELPLGAFATGLAVAVVLRAVHGSIFAHGGAWVIVSVIGGAAIFTWQSARRARRLGAALAVNT